MILQIKVQMLSLMLTPHCMNLKRGLIKEDPTRAILWMKSSKLLNSFLTMTCLSLKSAEIWEFLVRISNVGLLKGCSENEVEVAEELIRVLRMRFITGLKELLSLERVFLLSKFNNMH